MCGPIFPIAGIFFNKISKIEWKGQNYGGKNT
jgi:hypothetical protein